MKYERLNCSGLIVAFLERNTSELCVPAREFDVRMSALLEECIFQKTMVACRQEYRAWNCRQDLQHTRRGFVYSEIAKLLS